MRHWRCPVTLAIAVGFAVSSAGSDLKHPTVEEFQEEIQRADLVLRGRVTEVVKDEWKQQLTVQVAKLYKGAFRRERIIVCNFPWEPEDARSRGDDVILVLKRLNPFSSEPEPFGQRFYYVTSHIYRVDRGRVWSPTGMGDDLEAHKRVDRFVTLIEEAVTQNRRKLRRGRQQEQYVPGKVLFLDDFNDGSMSGWTLLKGARPGTPRENGAYGLWGEIWMGEGVAWKNDYFERAGMIGQLTRARGNRLVGERNGSPIQIGVYDGRLRLLSNHLLQHVTIVAGNPGWTDYQIDVDIYNRVGKLIEKPELLAQANYKKFGVFGRVSVPNLPQTKGEHCEVGVEFGNYANGIATSGTVNSDTFQIRLKTPDADWGRNWSTCMRQTKFLDYQTYEIPQDHLIHVTAKFMGNRVEGWIDGKKCVEGIIPDSNWPQFQHGRIGLWVFETFAEFDNVKVTELVRKE